MPINPLKDFFKKAKADVKFARAGPGQKLSEGSSAGSGGPSGSSSSSSSSSARQAAAEAAMKRFNKDSNKPAQRPKLAPPPATTSTAPPSTGVQDVSAEIPGVEKRTEIRVLDGVVQRDVQLYTNDELARRIKQPEIDDEFFRLTVEDAKLMQQRFNEERARNEILRTSEMRRREAEAKKPTTNVARLRFKLPNNLVFEASFSGGETLSVVRDWLVASCLDKAGLELKSYDILLGLRPFKEADFAKTLRELNLIPATTLTVVGKNGP